MKKWQKKVAIILMSMGIYFSTAHSPVAHATNIPPSDTVPMEHYFWGGYRKENVSIYEERGPIKRVSHNLVTPGYIYAQWETHQSTTVSGSIEGIATISTTSTVSSTQGYGTWIGSPGTYYLGFKVRYEVEEGYRVKDDVFGGQHRNYYKVRRPIYGQFEPVGVN